MKVFFQLLFTIVVLAFLILEGVHLIRSSLIGEISCSVSFLPCPIVGTLMVVAGILPILFVIYFLIKKR